MDALGHRDLDALARGVESPKERLAAQHAWLTALFAQRAFAHDIRALAISRMWDADEAADCVQEAWCRAWMYADQLRDFDSAAGWFKSVLINVCRMRHRARRRLRRGGGLTQVAFEHAAAAIDESADVEAIASARRELSRLGRDITALAQHDRELLMGALERPAGMRALAASMSMTHEQAKSRLHRARKRLRSSGSPMPAQPADEP
jgi:RNA polymerase sigma factor (sigma-70 family)